MMIKRISLIVITVSLICSVFAAAIFQYSYAVTASDWKAGNIIDDAMFIDSSSMSVAQIQAFLNSKVGTGYYGRIAGQCDTNGIRTSELGGGTRAQYGAAHGNPAPFTCLKDFYEVPKTTPSAGIPANNYGGKPRPTGSKSAAQLIWDAAQKYNISPKVLLVKLGTESAGPLTSDDWPFLRQYTYAMGAHCPDSGPGGSANCDTTYSGFSIQISEAAKMLRGYLDNMGETWWPYKKPYQTNSIYWNVVPSGCGASNVFIENKATAALYTYTPYQPNQAALNNMYGTGNSCSAYGNRNFWRTYNDWFGSTKYPQPIGAMLYRQSSNGNIFLFVNDKRFYIPSASIMSNYGLNRYRTVPASDTLISSTADGGTLTNTIRNDSGNVYLVNNGSKHYIPSSTVCTNWSIACYDSNVVRNLGGTFTNIYLRNGINLNSTAQYNSVYYQMSAGTRLPYGDTQSFTSSGFSTATAINANGINITQPVGKLQLKTAGLIKFAPKNTLYYFNGTNYYTITNMDVYNTWNLGFVHTINAPKSSYNTSDDVTSVANLGYWFKTTDGSKYIVNYGNKLKLSTTQQSLWPAAVYVDGLDTLANNLSAKALGGFIKSGISFYQLYASNGEKRYIASMDDYIDLGGNSSNTTRLNGTLTNSIVSGPFAFANGRLIKVDGDSTIYVVDSGKIMHVASMIVLNSYRFDTTKMRVYPLSSINEYEKLGQLQSGILPNGNVVVPYNRQLLVLTADQTTKSGIITSGFMHISLEMVNRANLIPTTQFWRNSDNGSIYYASGGALHHIGSISKYYSLGGKSTPLISVNTSIINMFAVGDPV